MPTVEAYNLIAELPHVGVVQFGSDKKIFDVNVGFCNLLGYSKDELLKLKISDLLHHGDDILASKEVRFRKKNHSVLWSEANLRAVKDKKGRPIFYICLLWDITNQKLNNLELAEIRTRPNEDQSCEAGKLSSCIIHEINNPLSIIHSRAHQMRDMIISAAEPAQLVHCVDRIENALDRIFKIVKSLDEDPREASLQIFGTYNLVAILNEGIALAEDRIKSEMVTIEKSLPNEEILVNCNPVQISQVILNLLNNAFDATAGISENKVIKISLKQKVNTVELSIQDNGTGINSEFADKIFNPYFTTKESGKGLGLGLSKMIVEAHNGALRLDGQQSFTTFVCELPLENKEFAGRN